MSFESQQSRIFLQEYLMNQLVSTRNVYVKTKVCVSVQLRILVGCINVNEPFVDSVTAHSQFIELLKVFPRIICFKEASFHGTIFKHTISFFLIASIYIFVVICSLTLQDTQSLVLKCASTIAFAM